MQDSSSFINLYRLNPRPQGKWLYVRSPGRINLIGEHTDYNRGLCFPAAIDKAVYFLAEEDTKFSIHALDRNQIFIQNQRSVIPDWLVYFDGVLKELNLVNDKLPKIKVSFGADLPSGAGLSSSSAISCGFAFVLNEFLDLKINKTDLMHIAIRGERHSGLEGGMMDQISIFNGRKDQGLLIDCQDWTFQYKDVRFKDYQWLVVDTKVHHTLVDSEYNSRSRACRSIVSKISLHYPTWSSIRDIEKACLQACYSLLDDSEKRLLQYVVEENQRVLEFDAALSGQDPEAAGQLLLAGHAGLKDLYCVSCAELNYLVSFAKTDPRAAGARMMGGGFGGSTLHLVRRDDIRSYRKDISDFYKKATGMEPRIFEFIVSNGLETLEMGQYI